MWVSLFELFSIGIGPSSSHTVGPMRAAERFVRELGDSSKALETIQVELFGSLALTGKGHHTDQAILLGLSGYLPETIKTEKIAVLLKTIREQKKIKLGSGKSVMFEESQHLLFHRGQFLVFHPNGLKFTAMNEKGLVLKSETFYSIGGGFIVKENEGNSDAAKQAHEPYAYQSATELLNFAKNTQKSIAEIVLANERTRHTEAEIKARISQIWLVMQETVRRGLTTEGVLPGGLKLKRRAPDLFKKLKSEAEVTSDPSVLLDWISVFALATNEENAAGGQVVTAPTNGAAGIIPAVLHYYQKFIPKADEEGITTFFLTATAIGSLYKFGASLSAAEMGCQGEVGVACSMAAAGLAAAMGGSPTQIENAAEIGMEHHLGLTCDPIGGLVQVPCIERNTMGALKAINAARLALHGDGTHRVSLDAVIAAMKQTGLDMKGTYKETSEAGLAKQISVSHPEC